MMSDITKPAHEQPHIVFWNQSGVRLSVSVEKEECDINELF